MSPDDCEYCGAAAMSKCGGVLFQIGETAPLPGMERICRRKLCGACAAGTRGLCLECEAGGGRREISPTVDRSAAFSKCGWYRYVLWRSWNPLLPRVVYVGCNPSDASDVADDNTVTRLIEWSQRFGYGSFAIVNLFALISSSPAVLKRPPAESEGPIGPDNDFHIASQVAKAEAVVGMWGTHGKLLGRAKQVRPLLPESILCFAQNADGSPKHPLYERKATRLRRLLEPKREPIAAGASLFKGEAS